MATRVRSVSVSVVNAVSTELKETKVASLEVWHWGRKHDWKSTIKTVFKRKYWGTILSPDQQHGWEELALIPPLTQCIRPGWWFALALTTALSALLSSYHHQIIAAISPYKVAIKNANWSWIPVIIILVIISFPPLFGHELVILAVGIIWGLGRGFAIACAGTFLGELACFYAFRYWFTNRAQKIEAKHLAYSCLAKMMREGGVGIIILVRFSAVPGHVTTAIQSTVGMSVWIYAIAATFSLPKQFALVYLGVVFGNTGQTMEEWKLKHPAGTTPLSDFYSGQGSQKQRHRISLIVFAATTLATLIAGWIVWMRIRRIRPFVIAEMEARRQTAARDLEEITTKEELVELDAETAAQAPEMSDRVVPWLTSERGVLSRPALSSNGSGSQIRLLPWVGRDRSSTMSTDPYSLNSPSLPHLPLPDDVDYFSLEDTSGARPRSDSAHRPRSGSMLRRLSM
ncbi:hypothetical protein P7C70_g3718, partial [Phenoliferia sp. Uapishka_3]